MRTYDPDEALDAAMRLFWKRGFSEASYDELTSVTGVSRKGLYTTFGDKRSLFLKCLQRYRQTQAVSCMDQLDQPNANADAISGLFTQIAASAKTPQGRMGCLMANTANDETANDPDVREQINLHFRRTRERFLVVLTRSGFDRKSASSVSDYLTGLLQGLFVLAHADAEQEMIDGYVQVGLRAIHS